MSESAFGRCPAELSISILSVSTWQDVLTCRLLSHAFLDLIDNCVDLQYKIQLGISGMVDNPYNVTTATQKLQLLKQYTAAWSSLSAESLSRDLQEIIMEDGWYNPQFTDGVFARCTEDPEHAIEFRRLPARIRGIPAKTWTVQFPCSFYCFSLDMAQDLFVGIVNVSDLEQQIIVRLQLYSLTTGQNHPLAAKPEFDLRNLFVGSSSREVRINGRYIGLRVRASPLAVAQRGQAYATISKVLIWEWQSGEQIYSDIEACLAFAFVGEQYLLVAKSPPGQERQALLVLVNLIDQSRYWQMSLPQIVQAPVIISLELSCELGAATNMSAADSPPFHFAQDERVIVLDMFTTHFEAGSTRFSFLQSGLLCLANQCGPAHEGCNAIGWDEWGYRYCRADRAPYPGPFARCMAYGLKHIHVRNISDDGDTVYPALVIRDYNQKMIRYILNRAKATKGISTLGICISDTKLRFQSGHDLFAEPVITSLPYYEVTIPSSQGFPEDILITADSIATGAEALGDGKFVYEVYSL